MKASIVEKIRQAGVVGAGGAGFPTHVKVNATVDTVLVNGASCEPLLMSDPWLLEKETKLVLRGLKAVLDCTGATRGLVCLKGKHEHAMQAVRAALVTENDARLELFELRDFYPAGDEQVLVQEALGRTVPEAGIPLQVGVVVSNVESLYNVALALDDMPVTERYVTVSGEVRTPMLVKTRVGAPVSELLDLAGGPIVKDFVVVDGGPMMGRVLQDTDSPVTKTTSGLLVLPPDHPVVSAKVRDPEAVRRITATVCCQCSQCTDLCPRHLLGHSLHPHKLMRAAHALGGASATLAAREALLCSECGICEKFACPMGVSPREVNAQLKKSLLGQGQKWESSGKPLAAHPFRQSRYVPTSRLMQRLDVTRFYKHFESLQEYVPSLVRLPLKQHIGAPALCVVQMGQSVRQGDVVGEIPEKALGARVHASVDGTVTSVDGGVVTIERQKN